MYDHHVAGFHSATRGQQNVVYENGDFTGTVGGGELEHRVLDEAWVSITDGKSRLLNTI